MSRRSATDARDQRAERGLIAAAMLDSRVAVEVEVEPDAFSHPLLGSLWAAARELAAAGAPVDPVAIADVAGRPWPEAKRAQLVTLASECLASEISAAAAEHHAGIVRRHAVTRRLLAAVGRVAEAWGSGEAEGLELLSVAQSALSEVEGSGVRGGAVRIGELVRGELAELGHALERQAAGEQVLLGAPTGVAALDELLGGLHFGQTTAVLGRPGMGKSALARAITSACVAAQLPVHVFSMEDTRRAYAHRTLAAESRVSAQAIRALNLQRHEFRALQAGAARLFEVEGWLVDDTTGLSAAEVVRSWRREKRLHGTRVVILDYVQLLRPPKGVTDPRIAVNFAMRELAAAASADDVALIVLSQMNRKCEFREGWNKRPSPPDASEAGGIEQSAKTMLGIMRPQVYGLTYPDGSERAGEPVPASVCEIGVIKNNHGPTGFAYARWDGPTTRVY